MLAEVFGRAANPPVSASVSVAARRWILVNIVVAMDSFKSTLKAADACVIITDVLSKTLSDVRVVMKPMADGGEGTARAMIEAARAVGCRWR